MPGVHARGQVASVKLSKLYDTKELKDSLNRYLAGGYPYRKGRIGKERVPCQKECKGKEVRILY